jgi:hypothetical protein
LGGRDLSLPYGPDISAIRKAPVYTPGMKKARLSLLLIAIALATLLAACGNKGELVRPEPKAEAGAG